MSGGQRYFRYFRHPLPVPLRRGLHIERLESVPEGQGRDLCKAVSFAPLPPLQSRNLDPNADALVMPGSSAREHVPHAIQRLSMPVPVTTIYGHTDFRLIAGETLYLHAGGALGPNGQVAGIQCEPGFGEKERLTAFAMRGPVSGERLRAGCEALARLVEVFTDRKDIGTALLAAGLRAPFGHMTSMLALVGSTGGGKSEGAALVQTMYAPGLDSQSFAACWYDTPTTLEGSMFWIRDGVLVIDDYAPEGTKCDQYRLEQTLARVIRSIGNHSSRGRSNADLRRSP
jgi:hypothetical protein